MGSYTNLVQGSTGEDVRKLQTALVNAGYDIGSSGVDGSYGPATASAVRKYQQDNGLTVDGMAGTQTQSKLYGTSTASAQPASTQTAQQNTSSVTSSYDPASDTAYQQALQALTAAQSNAPTYANSYDGQLQDLYNQIVNRDKFKYDINSDALYQQYADQYIQNGKLAMMDSMGQAAALTGGYGSSYGQAVGQQTYNSYLQQLNDKVPELYGLAYDQYQDEGNQLIQQYSMMGDLADDEYAKYQDAYNQWANERSYAQSQADTAYERGYANWQNQYTNQQNALSTNRENLLYLITASGYNPTDSELTAAGMTRAQADSLIAKYNADNATKSTGGSSSYSSTTSTGGDKTTGTTTYTYNDYMVAAANARNKGDKTSANAALSAGVQRGEITSKQAQEIKKYIFKAEKADRL